MDQTTTIIALMIDWFDNDGGGETKPAVIVEGETYCVVELRRVAVVPQRQSLSSLSSYHPLERAYWLWSELRGAIYGRVRRGMVLRCLDQPVHVSVDVKGSAVTSRRWPRILSRRSPRCSTFRRLLERRDNGGDTGGGRREDKDYLCHGHGGEGASDLARRPNLVLAGRLRLPG